jgi:uncharacterized protein YbjT (DUF2867 family)
MNILLCGATGFIGKRVTAALQSAGHVVTPAVANYARDTSASTWLPRLAGIDAVINAVGVLRDTGRRPIDAVHTLAPQALFDACAQAGSARQKPLRVIQISALGIEDNPTRYATSKRAADTHLLALHRAGHVDATVLRPSIVFGRGGASSEMFVGLSKLPVLVLPRPVLTARVQPVAVQDLARVIARLIGQTSPSETVECVGASALSLADFIGALRQQQGKKPARVVALPDWMSRTSARMGDLISVSPWCSETLALLANDNVSSSRVFAGLLAQPLRPLSSYWGHYNMAQGEPQ